MLDNSPGTPRRSFGGPVVYEKVVWAIFAVFLVFVLARYMQWGARRDILATIRIEFLTGGLVILASAVMLPSLRRFQTESIHVFLAAGALLLVVATQVPFAVNRALATIVFQDRVVKFAMLSFLIAVQVRNPLSLRLFVGAFLLSMLYITQESVQGLISGGLIWQNQGIMRLHGAVPMYAHPNSLGGVSVSVVPFCFFLLPAVKSWWQRLGLLALLGTATICVIFTGSRTAYVGYVAFGLGWFLISRNKRRWVAVAAAVLVAAAVFMPQEYKERFLSIGGQEAEGNSKESRIEIIRDALAIIQEYPAGVGVSSFTTVRHRKFGRAQDTHNLYLEVATNLGLHGLAVFLAFVWFVGRRMWLVWRKLMRGRDRLQALMRSGKLDPGLRRAANKDLTDLTFITACAQAAMFFLAIRLVVGLFGMDLYEIYWWFSAGMAICLTELADVAVRRVAVLEQRAVDAMAPGTLGGA